MANPWWPSGGTLQHAAKRPSVPGATGTYSNAGRPIGVAYGTPQRNYQHLLDQGTPLTFGSPHQLGTSQWNYSGPTLLPWQQPDNDPMQTFGGGTAGGMGSVRTSIVPRPIYSPQMTLAGTNQAVAEQHAMGNPSSLLKRFDSPGISRGAAHMARVAPLVARARQNANRARAQLPLEDAFANAQAMLQGEAAREGEAIGLANLGLRFRGNEQDLYQGLARQRLGQFGGMMNLVDSMFG